MKLVLFLSVIWGIFVFCYADQEKVDLFSCDEVVEEFLMANDLVEGISNIEYYFASLMGVNINVPSDEDLKTIKKVTQELDEVLIQNIETHNFKNAKIKEFLSGVKKNLLNNDETLDFSNFCSETLKSSLDQEEKFF